MGFPFIPALLWGLPVELARGCQARALVHAVPSCAVLGRGAFGGEGEGFWGEGKESEQGCVLLTP